MRCSARRAGLAGAPRRGRAAVQDAHYPCIVTTAPMVQGCTVRRYLGIVSGETIMGVNVLRDLTAGIRDVIGGRVGSYESELRKGRELALQEMLNETLARGA